MPTASIIILSILVLFMIVTVASFFVRKNKKLNIVVLLLHVLVFSVLFVASSIFWTKDLAVDVNSIQDLKFGWPIYFEVQNQDRFDPPFPYVMNRAWEVPTTYVFKNFIMDVTVVFFFISIIYFLFLFLKKLK